MSESLWAVNFLKQLLVLVIFLFLNCIHFKLLTKIWKNRDLRV